MSDFLAIITAEYNRVSGSALNANPIKYCLDVMDLNKTVNVNCINDLLDHDIIFLDIIDKRNNDAFAIRIKDSNYMIFNYPNGGIKALRLSINNVLVEMPAELVSEIAHFVSTISMVYAVQEYDKDYASVMKLVREGVPEEVLSEIADAMSKLNTDNILRAMGEHIEDLEIIQ